MSTTSEMKGRFMNLISKHDVLCFEDDGNELHVLTTREVVLEHISSEILSPIIDKKVVAEFILDQCEYEFDINYYELVKYKHG